MSSDTSEISWDPYWGSDDSFPDVEPFRVPEATPVIHNSVENQVTEVGGWDLHIFNPHNHEHINTIPHEEDPRHVVEPGRQHRYFVPAFTDANFPLLDDQTPPIDCKIPTGVVTVPTRMATWGDLPLEVEESLIECSMRADGLFDGETSLKNAYWVTPTSARYPRPSFLPSICDVSMHLRDVGGRVFVRNAQFTIQSKPANDFMVKFLESFAEETGFEAVRELRFTSFHRYLGIARFGSNSDLKLMARCPGLDRVQFTFHVDVLTNYLHAEDEIEANGGFGRRLKPIEDIVAYYDLTKIFDCGGLRVVAFDGIYNSDMDSDCSGDTKQHLQDLADWIVEGFASRKKEDAKVRVPTTEIKWRTGAYYYSSPYW